MKLFRTIALAALPLLAATFSHAAIVDAGSGPNATTTNADAAFLAWQGRLNAFVTDDLTGLAGTGNGTNNANLVSTLGNRFQSVTSAVAGGNDLLAASTSYNAGVIAGTSLFSRFTSGTASGATDFLWTLATPSNAFGFFAHDVDGATLGIQFVDGSSQSYVLSTGSANLNNAFWGISGLSSSIASVTISTTASGSTDTNFDRFSTGVTQSTVPEPGSLALVSLALLAAARVRRRPV